MQLRALTLIQNRTEPGILQLQPEAEPTMIRSGLMALSLALRHLGAGGWSVRRI
jgi:hypothetical protein